MFCELELLSVTSSLYHGLIRVNPCDHEYVSFSLEMSSAIYFLMQVGIPADREQYIHRLGRTGRKGKEGQGLLLLAPWEKYFLGSIKDLTISEAVVPSVDSSAEMEVSSILFTCHLAL
jgi:hypothetical protein